MFDEEEQRYTELSLFPEDREIPGDALHGLQVKLSGLELRRPARFGEYRWRKKATDRWGEWKYPK